MVHVLLQFAHCYNPSLRLFPQPAIRHYIPDCSGLKELTTQRLFFLQTLRNVANGRIECTSKQAVALAALALQALEGDFVSESVARHHIDERKLIPDGVRPQLRTAPHIPLSSGTL